MTIDEMIIQVRVTAEGVKQGVADALEELKKLEAGNERLTKFSNEELKKQEENHKATVDKITKQEELGQTNKLGKIKTGTTNILEYLQEMIADFAAKGNEAGEAYAEAFNEATERIMVSVNASASSSASTTAPATASASNVSVYNTFTMPVATPAKVASETAYALELMTRNI